MARAIDSEAAYRFLSEQLVKETGAFSKGVNEGLNIARAAMRNPDAIPTLRPVSGELVEKVWRGCEACKNADLAIGEVQFYGPFEGTIDVSGIMQYCPNCGRPIAPAAQEGQLERLEALYEAT